MCSIKKTDTAKTNQFIEYTLILEKLLFYLLEIC